LSYSKQPFLIKQEISPLETSLGYLTVQLTEVEDCHLSIGKLKDNNKQISTELNNNIVLHVVSFPNQVEVTLLETSLGYLTVQLTEAETCHASIRETIG
jgi:hypothetical protein